MRLLSFLITLFILLVIGLVYVTLVPNEVFIANSFLDLRTNAGNIGLFFSGLGALVMFFLLLSIGLIFGSADNKLTKKVEELKVKLDNELNKTKELEIQKKKLEEKQNVIEEKAQKKEVLPEN